MYYHKEKANYYQKRGGYRNCCTQFAFEAFSYKPESSMPDLPLLYPAQSLNIDASTGISAWIWPEDQAILTSRLDQENKDSVTMRKSRRKVIVPRLKSLSPSLVDF